MMRRNDSEEGMPFSWEKKPGISKLTATTTWVHQKHKFPTHSENLEIGRPVSSSSTDTTTARTIEKVCVEQQKLLKIPLPPCLVQPPPYGSSSSSRSSSIKGVGPLGLQRQQDDPFLAAYMECTKSVRNGNCTSSRYTNNSNFIISNGEDGDHKHKSRGSGSSLLKKSAFFFSCKHSCEVRDDSFVTLSHIPFPPPAPTSKLSKHPFPNN